MCNADVPPFMALSRKKLYEDVKHIQRNHWDEGLGYLTNHSIPQAEFRSTLVTQINFRLEARVLRTYHDVLECCVDASKSPTRNVDPNSDPMTVWLLAIVFEQLVFVPNNDPETSIIQTVHERMLLF